MRIVLLQPFVQIRLQLLEVWQGRRVAAATMPIKSACSAYFAKGDQ